MLNKLLTKLPFKKWDSYIIDLTSPLPITSNTTIYTELLLSGAKSVHQLECPNSCAAIADPTFGFDDSIFYEGLTSVFGNGKIFYRKNSISEPVPLDLGPSHFSFPSFFHFESNNFLLLESERPPYPAIFSLVHDVNSNIILSRVNIINSFPYRILDPIVVQHNLNKLTLVGSIAESPTIVKPLFDISVNRDLTVTLTPPSLPPFNLEGRLAGSVTFEDKMMHVPVQTSYVTYGDGIQYYSVNTSSGATKKMLLIKSFNNSFYGPHTINFNPSSPLSCLIDLCTPSYKLRYFLPKFFHFIRNK